MDDGPAVLALNEGGGSPWVLVCEHASNAIPARYRGLGLPEAELSRHIAWDIGAAALARALAARLDAPLFLAGFSRLLIDCNRPPGSATSIPAVSEATRVPGNEGLGEAGRRDRAERFFWPLHRRVAAHLDARRAAGRPAVVVGVHSFTPVLGGVARPWHAGVLFRRSAALGLALVEALRGPGLAVAANEPYGIADDEDWTVPVHGEARGLDAVLLEVRQDLVGDGAGARAWAARLARALRRTGPPPAGPGRPAAPRGPPARPGEAG